MLFRSLLSNDLPRNSDLRRNSMPLHRSRSRIPRSIIQTRGSFHVGKRESAYALSLLFCSVLLVQAFTDMWREAATACSAAATCVTSRTTSTSATGTPISDAIWDAE